MFVFTFEQIFSLFGPEFNNTYYMIILTMTPMKDYLIALAFTFMYYSRGIKKINKEVMSEEEKESLLFQSNQAKQQKSMISVNLQDHSKDILEKVNF